MKKKQRRAQGKGEERIGDHRIEIGEKERRREKRKEERRRENERQGEKREKKGRHKEISSSYSLHSDTDRIGVVRVTERITSRTV